MSTTEDSRKATLGLDFTSIVGNSNLTGTGINTACLVNTNGELLVNAGSSGGGGDATAANQVLQLNQETVIANNTSNIDTNTGIVSGAVVAGAMQVDIQTDAAGLATETTLSTLDGKISKGEQSTITGGSGGLQQVLLYGVDTTNDLHPIKITPQGDIDVEIAEYPKGQETMANSFPVVVSSDQSNLNTKLIAQDNLTVERNVRCDANGKLIVQVDGVRSSGSETINIPDGATGTSSAILMGTNTRIAFYGDTDNTTNTNIFIEYSQDGTNWYRGAGDNAKIIIVGATGNFYDEEHITPPRVRISRPNTSGAAETLQLYYTQL